MQIRQALVLSLVLGSLSLAQSARAANLVNGGFETGNLNSWTISGSAAVQTAAFGSGPTVGTYDALISNSTATPTPSLEAFLGLSAGTLSNLGNGLVIEGAAIRQTVSVNAGDLLTFDWNFLTDEFTPDPVNNDFAFYTINNRAFTLADTNAAFTSSNTSFGSETGFSTLTVALATAGTYTFGFGVADVGTADGNSGLLLDNVAVVPEPSSTLGLFFLGLGGIVLKRRSVTKP